MRQFNKFRGTKGFISGWERMIRFRDMIAKTAQERTRILTFWNKHGDVATKEAFNVSRPTLFRWQKALDEAGGRLDALNPKSTAPKTKRKRVILPQVEALILKEREWEQVSKDKLATLIKEDGLGSYSASTVGRMLGDMKKRGILPNPVKVSMYGKTGNVIERIPKPYKAKLRSKGHEGGLAKADSIVRFTNGIKRYILTAMDCESKFAFAYAYTSHSSKAASEFMEKFTRVSPIPITHVQTDNGSEFADHFDIFLADNDIVHFHTYPRCPKMNAEIERFNRTLSEAFISRNRMLLANDIDAFNAKLIEWLLWYNSRRPHWSLGLISPMRYICDQLPAKSQMWWTDAYL